MSEDTHEPLYQNLQVEKGEHSTATISAEIPVSVVDAHRSGALKALSKDIDLPGFRKGHVPEAMVVERLGEQAILEETAQRVLAHAYPHILQEQKLDAVGRPEVTITKLAPGNPIEFKIGTALYPDITLPDYKKVAADTLKKQDDPEKVAVTDKEFEAELTRLREALAEKPEKEGDKPELPELTDEFVQKLGDFKTVDQFKETMRGQVLREKKRKEYEKRRIALVDALLAKSTFAIPGVFVDGELDKMMGEFGENVARMGMSMEDYLKKVEKTEADLRTEWRPDAEKRARLQLVLLESI
jgi:FKBP-type peptidyl-prolyl cis-trans isomerase (trigger factor)